MPTVSIIIPIYKSEKCIEAAVESVLKQSFSDFEVLLIDDGSPDNSLQVCRKLSEKDSRVKTFHKENGGLCSARNFGLRHATGKYIAFLDHDDEYMDGYLADNITLLEKYNADIVKFGRINKVWNENGEFKMVHEKKFNCIPEMKDGIAFFDKTGIEANFCRFRDAVKTMYIWDGIYAAEFISRHELSFDEQFKFGHEDNMFNLNAFEVADSVVFNNKEYYVHNYDVKVSTSAVYRPVRIDDAIRTTRTEVELLKKWNTDDADMLVSIMNEFFLVMNILNLKKGEVKYSDQRAAIIKFRDNTFTLLNNEYKAVKGLAKRDKKTGLWAFCLINKWIFISIFMYKAYRVCFT